MKSQALKWKWEKCVYRLSETYSEHDLWCSNKALSLLHGLFFYVRCYLQVMMLTFWKCVVKIYEIDQQKSYFVSQAWVVTFRHWWRTSTTSQSCFGRSSHLRLGYQHHHHCHHHHHHCQHHHQQHRRHHHQKFWLVLTIITFQQVRLCIPSHIPPHQQSWIKKMKQPSLRPGL